MMMMVYSSLVGRVYIDGDVMAVSRIDVTLPLSRS
jgi:hypothetical protein